MKCADFCTLFFIYMCTKINCNIPFFAVLLQPHSKTEKQDVHSFDVGRCKFNLLINKTIWKIR